MNDSTIKARLVFLNGFLKWYFSKYWQVRTRWVFTQTVTYGKYKNYHTHVIIDCQIWVFNSFHNFYIHDAQYLCIKISQRCFHLWTLCPLENLYIHNKFSHLCNRILEIYRRQIKTKILLLEMFVAHRLPIPIGLFCWAEFYSRENTIFIST